MRMLALTVLLAFGLPAAAQEPGILDTPRIGLLDAYSIDYVRSGKHAGSQP